MSNGTPKEYKKIEAFTDLAVWQEAHKLVVEIYVITKKFSKEEVFAFVTSGKRNPRMVKYPYGNDLN